ncbi:IS3 family transposase [Actinophytocola sp.]|uniref:IS3 family transposase n=1 Tax=Actinophytocola sp. TaxID=1872138 RepID=UPI003D6A809C
MVEVGFHTDRGSTDTAHSLTTWCARLGFRPSKVLSRRHFRTREEAQQVIVNWVVDFYNRRRRHSSCCGTKSPIDYETTAANQSSTIWGDLTVPHSSEWLRRALRRSEVSSSSSRGSAKRATSTRDVTLDKR